MSELFETGSPLWDFPAGTLIRATNASGVGTINNIDAWVVCDHRVLDYAVVRLLDGAVLKAPHDTLWKEVAPDCVWDAPAAEPANLEVATFTKCVGLLDELASGGTSYPKVVRVIDTLRSWYGCGE